MPGVRGGVAAAAAWLLSFGSIVALLGWLGGIAPMWWLGLLASLPTFVALGVLAVHARGALRETLHAGLWGGLWGTLGYDLVRVPVHLAGLNPFAPIRSYGVYLLDAPHATAATDLLGVAYHLSNGLTFGVLYAIPMRGRSPGWGLAWGLALESLAVATPFGAVYGIRDAPVALVVAYAAHLWYGLPLGLACRDPAGLARRLEGGLGARVGVASALALGAFVAWFLFAWEPPGAVRPASGIVAMGPGSAISGWTRVDAGTPVRLENHDGAPLQWAIAGVGEGRLGPGEHAVVALPRPGIFVLSVRDRGWRSAAVSVDEPACACPRVVGR